MSHSCIIFNGNLYLVPLGRRRLTWEGEIEVGLQEFLGGEGVLVVDWMIRLWVGTGGARL